MLLYLIGRSYSEAYYKGLGIPTLLIEWSWASTITVGGFISFGWLMIILSVISGFLFVLGIIGTKPSKWKWPKNGNFMLFKEMCISVIPFTVMFYFSLLLLLTGNKGKEDAKSYLSNPEIISYSLINDKENKKQGVLLLRSASDIIYYITAQETQNTNPLRLSFSDFHHFEILGKHYEIAAQSKQNLAPDDKNPSLKLAR